VSDLDLPSAHSSRAKDAYHSRAVSGALFGLGRDIPALHHFLEELTGISRKAVAPTR
jgi:hypothetical protein